MCFEDRISSIVAERAAGCIVGALIGDALDIGPHWYHDPGK